MLGPIMSYGVHWHRNIHVILFPYLLKVHAHANCSTSVYESTKLLSITVVL